MLRVFFPGLRLMSTKTECCDPCMRVKTELCDPSIIDERRTYLKREKQVHLDSAIKQRRVWANFVRDYAGKEDLNLLLPEEIVHLTIGQVEPLEIENLRISIEDNEDVNSQLDDQDSLRVIDSTREARNIRLDVGASLIDEKQDLKTQDTLLSSKVLLQAEDHGRGLALPQFGYKTPSEDDFNSNLIAYNFVVCDITSGSNHVY